MKRIFISCLLVVMILSCAHEKSNSPVLIKSKNLIKYVNPLIGTKNMGHTFPGAAAPFGMVQLSPETNAEPMFIDGKYNKKTYEYCSGYQYADSTIFGFSHTHFSGTGHSDLGDFLIMPSTGELQLEPGKASQPGSGYHSAFSHDKEFAEPAYYKVFLEDYQVQAELTASERVGFHRYTFQKSDDAHIILDLMANIYHHDDKNVWTFIRVENDSLVTGYRQTNGWARTKKVFFAMKFSKPFKSYGHKRYEKVIYNGFYRKFNEEENFPEMSGKNIRAYFNFDTKQNEEVKVKFALSCVSTNGALKNLETEVPHWDFNRVKQESQAKWNQELSKLVVETESEDQKENIYTSLYHTMLSPVLYEDVDGSYRGLDQNIHQSDGFTNYSIFSLWDTYRALHPWFTILQPERNNDMIKSMLAHHDQSVHKMLPVWSHYANENWCMVGYHSVSVIADAIAKNATDVDLARALQACKNTSTLSYYDGIGDYMKLGYVPEDNSSSSVSKTLEYAYNDWCIAQIAKAANEKETEHEYNKRSEYYKNVYDAEVGYMRPKLSNGQWRKEFDPLNTHGQGFIEGNAWNYGLYVPHNISNMIEMMGGKDKFSNHLDRIFTTPIDDKYIEKNEDITRDGIIGNYVHGNEPGHHIPYLYNWTNDPWKTQERVRMILDTMYSNEVDGLCGNDDAGQMSAWYLFSSLGFYPVLPGSDEYAIGSPSVQKAVLHLPNGNQFVVNTVNQSKENVFVEKVELNGNFLTDFKLKHSEIVKGGEIVFYMSNQANK
ncbi:GH92 family glycosyl hydrolase [Marinifilum caeruleilacunae]|uniref:Glycoside hydrolase family 92 protein n=1 Tax=Marinifilum caeruleilacunae TaxID=2499076 RepID=A0ABX1WRV8_9BACT|nr:GH92 family glycosyl hydrolase [Marinifilum caeruleilacunae]NOU58700.1 glycoside hydrolase family 92 protein [Marinifilum caeruleilacunae]